MKTTFRHLVFASLLMAAGCATPPEAPVSTPEPSPSSFSFILFGDMPYSDSDREFLKRVVPDVKAAAPPFIVHLGDYKGGGETCLSLYDGFFQSVFLDGVDPIPVFYTPGDNEWTDCDRFKDQRTGKTDSALARLDTVRALYFKDLPSGSAQFSAERQAELVENSTWTHGGVRFLTLHQTGTNNGRDYVTGDRLDLALEEVSARDEANLKWLEAGFAKAKAEGAEAVVIGMQADMTDVASKPADVMCTTVATDASNACDGHTALRAAIQRLALDFQKPVLLMHGDTNPYTLDQSLSGEEAPNLWRLNAAGDGVQEIVTVTVAPSADMPFSATGFTTGKAPASN